MDGPIGTSGAIQRKKNRRSDAELAMARILIWTGVLFLSTINCVVGGPKGRKKKKAGNGTLQGTNGKGQEAIVDSSTLEDLDSAQVYSSGIEDPVARLTLQESSDVFNAVEQLILDPLSPKIPLDGLDLLGTELQLPGPNLSFDEELGKGIIDVLEDGSVTLNADYNREALLLGNDEGGLEQQLVDESGNFEHGDFVGGFSAKHDRDVLLLSSVKGTYQGGFQLELVEDLLTRDEGVIPVDTEEELVNEQTGWPYRVVSPKRGPPVWSELDLSSPPNEEDWEVLGSSQAKQPPRVRSRAHTRIIEEENLVGADFLEEGDGRILYSPFVGGSNFGGEMDVQSADHFDSGSASDEEEWVDFEVDFETYDDKRPHQFHASIEQALRGAKHWGQQLNERTRSEQMLAQRLAWEAIEMAGAGLRATGGVLLETGIDLVQSVGELHWKEAADTVVTGAIDFGKTTYDVSSRVALALAKTKSGKKASRALTQAKLRGLELASDTVEFAKKFLDQESQQLAVSRAQLEFRLNPGGISDDSVDLEYVETEGEDGITIVAMQDRTSNVYSIQEGEPNLMEDD